MKKKLTNNLSLKILSLGIGILVWLVVVNIDNPITTKSFTITDVEVLNEAYIDADGKMCLQDEDQSPVRVTIQGPRRVLDDISIDDVTAVADLQQAVSLNTDPVMVPITVTCRRITTDNITVTPQNLSLHLEDKETQEFVVNVTTNNTRPDKDYEVGTLTSSPEKIKITGPTSLINKIDKVNASINVEGATDTVVNNTTVQIIDKNGEEFSDTDKSYLNLSEVTVTARLWKVQSDIRISADYSGTPAEGYEVIGITTTPNVISVAGSNDALEALASTNNTISIPPEAVDVTGLDKDYESKINISDYLPEGIKLTSDSSEDVFVLVNILPEGSTLYEVDTKNITVENLADGLQVAFDTATIEVRIKKTDEEADNLKTKDIEASIDLRDMTEDGTYDVPVSIVLPDGYELVDDVTAGIEVSEITTAE